MAPETQTALSDSASFEEILSGDGIMLDVKRTPSQWAEESRVYEKRLVEACALNGWKLIDATNPLGNPASYITADEFAAGMKKVQLFRVRVLLGQTTKEFRGRFYIGRFFPWGETVCDVCKSELRELMYAKKDGTLTVTNSNPDEPLSPPPTDSRPVEIPEARHPERAAVKASEDERVLREDKNARLTAKMTHNRGG